MYVSLVLLVGHLYLAVIHPATRHALRGITAGSVERGVGGDASREVEARMSPMTTVLVVDDEPIVRDVVVRYLRRDGFATLEAADGDRARELIERAAPSSSCST